MKKIIIAVLAGFLSMSVGAYAGEMKDDMKKSDTGMTKSGKGMDKKGDAMAKDDGKSDKKKAKKKDETTK